MCYFNPIGVPWLGVAERCLHKHFGGSSCGSMERFDWHCWWIGLQMLVNILDVVSHVVWDGGTVGSGFCFGSPPNYGL